MPDVIIFSIGDDWLARAACNAILIQGIGQYLVNLNIWTHNILTLLARSQVPHCACMLPAALSRLLCSETDPPSISSAWGLT